MLLKAKDVFISKGEHGVVKYVLNPSTFYTGILCNLPRTTPIKKLMFEPGISELRNSYIVSLVD